MRPFRFTIRQLLEATTWVAVECLCLREAAAMRGPDYLDTLLPIWLLGSVALGNLIGIFVGHRQRCCLAAFCIWPYVGAALVTCITRVANFP